MQALKTALLIYHNSCPKSRGEKQKTGAVHGAGRFNKDLFRNQNLIGFDFLNSSCLKYREEK